MKSKVIENFLACHEIEGLSVLEDRENEILIDDIVGTYFRPISSQVSDCEFEHTLIFNYKGERYKLRFKFDFRKRQTLVRVLGIIGISKINRREILVNSLLAKRLLCY